MELKLNLGIGDIIFGINELEVKNLFGKPDLIDESWDNDKELVYYYNQHKLCLTFLKNDDGKLGIIRSANPRLKYLNKEFINHNVRRVKNEIFKIDNDQWEIEEFEFHQIHYTKKGWLCLEVRYNEVTEIEIGVPYKNYDEHNWEDVAKLAEQERLNLKLNLIEYN